MTGNNNWCPSCEEPVHGHARICTVCGTSLVARPTTTSTISNRRSNSNTNNNGNDNNQRNREVQQWMMQAVAGEAPPAGVLSDEEYRAFVMEANANAANPNAAGALWESIPAQLLDPSNDSGARGRPTAQKTLQQLPRIRLTDQSSFFYESVFTVCGGNGGEGMPAVSAEFGPKEETSCTIENACVVIPDSANRTGKDGQLSLGRRLSSVVVNAAVPDEDNNHNNNKATTTIPLIVYAERGAGVTFVQKALMAQNEVTNYNRTNIGTKLELKAVVIGNNTPSPWPYIMKDSKNEAVKKGPLTVPVVMIPQHGARTLVAMAGKNSNNNNAPRADLRITNHNHKKECVICSDPFRIGQTIITLPVCGHSFHEKCALAWLTKHNTCPTCRLELPTDNEEYEQERRRVQRTHAGSSGGGRNNQENNQWNLYYG